MAVEVKIYTKTDIERKQIGEKIHNALVGSRSYKENEILLNIDLAPDNNGYPIYLLLGEDKGLTTTVFAEYAGVISDNSEPTKKEEKVKTPFANFFRELNKCDRVQPFSTAYLESRPPLPQGYKYIRYDLNNGIRYFNYREFIAVDRILIDTENKDYILNGALLDMILGTNSPCLYISPSNSNYVDVSDDFGKVVNNSKRNQVFDLMLAEARFTPQIIYQSETQLVPTEFILYNIVGLAGEFDDVAQEFELQAKKSEFKMMRFLHDISKKLFTSVLEKPNGDES